jgi:hypothetical protein
VTIAGRIPATTLSGFPKWPLAANTAETTAMANTAPKRCSVLMTPEALPTSCAETALRAAVGVVGRAIEIPTPPSTRGKTRVP